MKEVPNIIISDLQVGHRTPTYNFEVFNQRLVKIGDQAIGEILRRSRDVTIPEIKIRLLGDLIHGERVFKTVDLDELEDVVKVQMYDVAIPALEKFIARFADFIKVTITCIKGNHGKVHKEASLSNNYDLMIYQHLKASLKEYKNIHFDICDNFYTIDNLFGKKYMFIHGDEVKSHGGKPWSQIADKALKWHGALGGFDYLCLGHFHTFGVFDYDNMTVLINGTLVTDDQWVLRTMGLPGSCSQLMFFAGDTGISYYKILSPKD